MGRILRVNDSVKRSNNATTIVDPQANRFCNKVHQNLLYARLDFVFVNFLASRDQQFVSLLHMAQLGFVKLDDLQIGYASLWRLFKALV